MSKIGVGPGAPLHGGGIVRLGTRKRGPGKLQVGRAL